ncbi:MAG: homocysteine S-methyltransferase family protein [Desulfovibrio sp.]|nr:homocysteine S-methyltransferase family protein [Desulfovibrio sp.]
MSFTTALSEGRLLFLDGAMGTLLQAEGLPSGMSPERFCLNRPDILCGIHKRYLEAGSNIITTCTFGGNPFKLESGLDVFHFNKTMAQIARKAAESAREPVFVAGNVGPSGQFAKPLGAIEPSAMIDAYASQIKGLVAGGVDLLFIETQFDLAEARACVVAARTVTNLPVMVSMTFEAGLSLTGSTPEIFVATMQNLGVDVIGTNCSLGPDEMGPVIERMANSSAILMAEPNAGLPEVRGKETVFPLNAELFAQKTAPFAAMGVQILGGCCGTTPAHIRELKKAVTGQTLTLRSRKEANGICLTSRSKLVCIGEDAPFCLIGERINPTGKKDLTEELQHNCFDRALRFADEQCSLGAALLDVNVGAPLVDETRLLPELTSLLVGRVEQPLVLDSSNIDALVRALPFCPGSALINSISGEGSRMEDLAPLCARYGAPFILLPLCGKDLPLKAKERQSILEKLLAKASSLGIPKRLIMVDILALTISANADSAKECLRILAWCREQGLPTTLGLSNISFGLPARELVNASFLTMAAGCGLTSCIANPNAERVREAVHALHVLTGHDPHAESFIANYASWKPRGGEPCEQRTHNRCVATLYDAVVHGDKEHILSFLDADLANGKEPFFLVQQVLIPAITEVGKRYERKEYFLPQLIRSAETMQKAFAHLKPLLENDTKTADRPVIVMATVEGDIHDIGKNIVSLMLSNHGFEVIDCGKDVPAETIVRCAREHNAQLIGLSALMTTTMVKMEETIHLVHDHNLPIKVLVGGAAVTQDFADTIGADAYCEDAVVAVKAAKRLMGETR